MTSLQVGSSQQLENISRAKILETVVFPERGDDEGDFVRPMASPMIQVNFESSGGLRDLWSARVWGNHLIWRAGASVLKASALQLTIVFCIFFFADH